MGAGTRTVEMHPGATSSPSVVGNGQEIPRTSRPRGDRLQPGRRPRNNQEPKPMGETRSSVKLHNIVNRGIFAWGYGEERDIRGAAVDGVTDAGVMTLCPAGVLYDLPMQAETDTTATTRGVGRRRSDPHVALVLKIARAIQPERRVDGNGPYLHVPPTAPTAASSVSSSAAVVANPDSAPPRRSRSPRPASWHAGRYHPTVVFWSCAWHHRADTARMCAPSSRRLAARGLRLDAACRGAGVELYFGRNDPVRT